jgi:hypothetical protein
MNEQLVLAHQPPQVEIPVEVTDGPSSSALVGKQNLANCPKLD